jgi:cytochrome bd-type quinol oxidase subunit 2
MSKPRSYHILPTSADLLGFSFLVLTSERALGISITGATDKAVSVCVILFATNTLLSYLSIRREGLKSKIDYEKWSERIFIMALILTAVLSVVIVFDVDSK